MSELLMSLDRFATFSPRKMAYEDVQFVLGYAQGREEDAQIHGINLLEEQFHINPISAKQAEAIYRAATHSQAGTDLQRDLMHWFYSIIQERSGLPFDVDQITNLEMTERSVPFDDHEKWISSFASKFGGIYGIDPERLNGAASVRYFATRSFLEHVTRMSDPKEAILRWDEAAVEKLAYGFRSYYQQLKEALLAGQ